MLELALFLFLSNHMLQLLHQTSILTSPIQRLKQVHPQLKKVLSLPTRQLDTLLQHPHTVHTSTLRYHNLLNYNEVIIMHGLKFTGTLLNNVRKLLVLPLNPIPPHEPTQLFQSNHVLLELLALNDKRAALLTLPQLHPTLLSVHKTITDLAESLHSGQVVIRQTHIHQ
jgi:hypothetical protein